MQHGLSLISTHGYIHAYIHGFIHGYPYIHGKPDTNLLVEHVAAYCNVQLPLGAMEAPQVGPLWP